jgi:hypothetical protein
MFHCSSKCKLFVSQISQQIGFEVELDNLNIATPASDDQNLWNSSCSLASTTVREGNHEDIPMELEKRCVR